MMKSRKRKFIFVHIQKTGGTSIKILLKQVPDCRVFLGTHDFARAGQEKLQDRWDKFYKFAVVRNPWDRLVSWYSMFVKHRGNPDRKKNLFMQYVWSNSNSFEEFVTNCTAEFEDNDGMKCIMYDQIDYLTDESGKLLVDFVGRFENFQADAAIIFDTIGLGQVELPHNQKSVHDHYSTYYTPALRDLVGERHQRDIEVFNYSFDENVVMTSGNS